MDSRRVRSKELAEKHRSEGRFLHWFEALYKEASGDSGTLPWADLAPNPNLLEWVAKNSPIGQGKRAAVVGCGLGDDAEAIAALGFEVTAFDIAPTAIEWCRKRFPNSAVQYQLANLFDLPRPLRRSFDFVFEAYTIQSMPPEMQPGAAVCLLHLLAPGGRVLVICRGFDGVGQPDGPPWAVARSTLDLLPSDDVRQVNFEDYYDSEDPPVRRFRAEYVAANTGSP
jgi:SAM-dependent methyltransferase